MRAEQSVPELGFWLYGSLRARVVPVARPPESELQRRSFNFNLAWRATLA